MKKTEFFIIYIASILLCIAADWLGSHSILAENSYILVLLAFMGLPSVGIYFFRRKRDSELLELYWSNRDFLFGFGVVILIFFPVLLGAIFWYTFIGNASFSWSWGNYQATKLTLLYSFLTHIFLVALPEEYFYRGYLQGSFIKLFTPHHSPRKASIFAILLTSVLFAIGHIAVSLNPWSLSVFFPSLLFGVVRLKSNSLVAAIIVHGMANFMMEFIAPHFYLA